MLRRDFLSGVLPLCAWSLPASARTVLASQRWTFDNFRHIGGHRVQTPGSPRLTVSPWGPATLFDGSRNALLIDAHPLAGARKFTFEALFRPDGGPFEQRWFHLESHETGAAPGTGHTRILFEIRVTGESWYLDAFVAGQGYKQTLIVPARRFPIGQWYHVAQSFDGTTFRSFVDGHLQMAAETAFAPQGPGRSAIGMRLNGVNHFHGAVRAAHFSHDYLPPSRFRLPMLR